MNSSIIVFDYSSYYTVVAGRYDDKETAKAILEDYKELYPNEEVYIHTRKSTADKN